MPSLHRHDVREGLAIAALTLSSFGLFLFASAQVSSMSDGTTAASSTAANTDTTTATAVVTLDSRCREKGLTTIVDCEAYLKALAEAATVRSPVCGNGACESGLGETTAACATDCPAATVTPVTVQLPDACVTAGITTVDACASFISAQRKTEATETMDANTPTETTTTNAVDEKPVVSAVRCGDQFCDARNGETSTNCSDDCGTAVVAPTVTLDARCREKGIAAAARCETYLAEVKRAAEKAAAAAAVAAAEREAAAREAAAAAQKKMQAQEAMRELKTKTEVPAPIIATVSDESFTPTGYCRLLNALTRDACEAVTKKAASEIRSKDETATTAVVGAAEANGVSAACRTQGMTSASGCATMVAAATVPQACLDAGQLDDASCRAYIERESLPSFCATRGIVTRDACRSAIFAEYGRPAACANADDGACWNLVAAGKADATYVASLAAASKEALPEECRKEGATTFVECERLREARYVPEACRTAGVYTRAACEAWLYGRAGTKAGVDAGSCASLGVADAAACRAAVDAAYFPAACVAAGIADAATCRLFLARTVLPDECRAVKLDNADECDRYLRTKHLARATAEDVNALLSTVVCEGVTAEQCAISLKERHLGAVAAAANAARTTRETLRTAQAGGTSLDLSAMAVRADDAHARMRRVLPIAGETGTMTVIRSDEKVMIAEDGSVRAAAPAAIAFDADADGVPDDVERRNGLDPRSADSDGDGTSDGQELGKDAAPIDRAFAAGKAIGQPTVEGAFDAKLGVATVAGGKGFVLAGTGVPGEVVTIYVYSDLPLVMTTTVDASGEWRYELDDRLRDGDHEAYVAINDEEGRVTRKSNPLAFVVSAAQAQTAADQAATQAEATASAPVADAEKGSVFDKSVRLFAIGGVALVLLAIGIVALILRGTRPPENGAGR